MKEIMYPI